MTPARPSALALLALTLAGCDSTPPSLAPPAPHGGALHKLSDGRNSVEVVREGAGGPEGSKLLLYFCDAELRPIARPPASATLQPKGRGAARLEFKPTGNADAAKAGELASPAIPPSVDPSGELAATVEGKPVTAVISVR